MAFADNIILSLYLFCLLFFTISTVHISLSPMRAITPVSIFNPNRSPPPSIHDLLPLYGLPKGLLPSNIKSYSLSSTDNSFTIQLTHPCYVQFDELVYYDVKIKGKLSYGKVFGVSGIQAKQLLFWVPVTGIDSDVESGTIEFHVGPLSKTFPAKQFEIIRDCKNNQACHESRPEVASI